MFSFLGLFRCCFSQIANLNTYYLKLGIKVYFIVCMIGIDKSAETSTPVRLISLDEERNKCDGRQTSSFKLPCGGAEQWRQRGVGREGKG